MDENFSHFIEMAMAILLFVFGLSAAVISYNRYNTYLKEFMYVNSESRRGRASDDRLDIKNEEIDRKAGYEEIVLTALNLPKNISVDGNGNQLYHRILIKRKSNKQYLITYNPTNESYRIGETKNGKVDNGNEFVSSITYAQNNTRRVLEDIRGKTGNVKYKVTFSKTNSYSNLEGANLIIYQEI